MVKLLNCMTLLLSHSRKRVIFFSIGICFVIGIFLVLGFAYHLVSPAYEGGSDQTFVVREGATLKQVARALEDRGLISSKSLFLLWTRVVGYGRHIKAGEYRLSPDMPPVKILNILKRGMIVTHPLTIPEGFTSEQIADLLDHKNLLENRQFLSLVKDRSVARDYGIPGPGLEGYLYPDTYHFARGLSARTVVDTMVNRFWEVFSPFEQRANQLGMRVEEVITLASIVEKETGVPEERPVIASVFLNRLERGMRLASDPTVIYGIENFNGNLTRKDLKEPHPYNTYIHRGLPPTPIANPGLASIRAVLYPADTDYLYFVSKNDGTHHFSETLEEHIQAVNTYQKKGRP